MALEYDTDGASKRRFYTVLNMLPIKRSDSILDLGCSSGDFLSLLERHRASEILVGIDLNRKAVRTARKGNNVSLVCANAEYLPFRSTAFTKVIALELLQFLKVNKCLIEVRRALKSKGNFIVSCPNNEFLLNYLEPRYISWIRNRIGVAFSENDLKILLSNNGFRIIEVRKRGTFVQCFYSIFRLMMGGFNILKPSLGRCVERVVGRLVVSLDPIVDREFLINSSQGHTIFVLSEVK